jgi:hypothetical protein
MAVKSLQFLESQNTFALCTSHDCTMLGRKGITTNHILSSCLFLSSAIELKLSSCHCPRSFLPHLAGKPHKYMAAFYLCNTHTSLVIPITLQQWLPPPGLPRQQRAFMHCHPPYRTDTPIDKQKKRLYSRSPTTGKSTSANKRLNISCLVVCRLQSA